HGRRARQTALGLGDRAQAGLQGGGDELAVAVDVPVQVVVPVEDEDDVAGGLVLGERLREYLLGAAAGAVGREELELPVLGDLAPRRGGEPRPGHEGGPGGQQQRPPPANDLTQEAEDHGSARGAVTSPGAADTPCASRRARGRNRSGPARIR